MSENWEKVACLLENLIWDYLNINWKDKTGRSLHDQKKLLDPRKNYLIWNAYFERVLKMNLTQLPAEHKLQLLKCIKSKQKHLMFMPILSVATCKILLTHRITYNKMTKNNVCRVAYHYNYESKHHENGLTTEPESSPSCGLLRVDTSSAVLILEQHGCWKIHFSYM